MSDRKQRPAVPRSGGVADLRETRPKGAGQFSAIVKTKVSDAKSAEGKAGKRGAPTTKGFAASDLKQLKKTEKRYADSRRAATASGRDTLYD